MTMDCITCVKSRLQPHQKRTHSSTAIALILCINFHRIRTCQTQAVFPPVLGNVAIGVPTSASACFDPTHCSDAAVDGNERTSWRSPTHVANANVTIDLGVEHELQSIIYTFEGPVARNAVIYRSSDGVSWQPYQFFSANCSGTFGVLPGWPPIADGSDVTEVAGCSPISMSMSVLSFEPLQYRTVGQVPYIRNDALQRFARTRYLRLSVRGLFTAADAFDDFGSPLGTLPQDYFGISTISVSGRCSCNGHANICETNASATTFSRSCVCQHNTQGATCDECEPLYNAKPWVRGVVAAEPSACMACDCHGHATSCHYNATIDEAPSSRLLGSGGVCDSCGNGTIGVGCETCGTGLRAQNVTMPPTAAPIVAAFVCVSCACHPRGTVANSTCSVPTGQCQCVDNVTGVRCDRCVDGFFGLETGQCVPCGCDPTGIAGSASADGVIPCGTGERMYTELSSANHTVASTPIAGVIEYGQCLCKPTRTGRQCSDCADGYYALRDFASTLLSCAPCDAQCSSAGCTGPGPTQCIACRNANSTAGVCVEACQPFEYAAADSTNCVRCDSNCQQGCTGPGASVAACNGECRYFEDTTRAECVRTCPWSTFADRGSRCVACSAQCAAPANTTTSGVPWCVGPSARQCHTCANYTLPNGTCVGECAPGTRAVLSITPGTDTCLPCSAVCDQLGSCTGPNADECDRCGMLEMVGADNRTVCVRACPRKHYVVPAAARGGDVIAGLCTACHPECGKGCVGPLATDCLEECQNFFVPHTNRTVITDDAGVVLLAGECVSACPRTTYELTITEDEDADNVTATLGAYDGHQLCLPCHPSCSTAHGCTGPSDAECIACGSAAFLLNATTCVETCPPGFLGNTSVGRCTQCARECLGGCSGGTSPADCDACANYRFEGTCVDECPTGTFVHAVLDSSGSPLAGLECLPCNDQCDPEYDCSGPSSSQCDVCAEIAHNSDCVSTCPDAFYRVNSSCTPCDHECALGCTGPGPRACRFGRCRHVTYRNTCVSHCNATQYSVGGECFDCSPQCSSLGCEGATAEDCVTCAGMNDTTRDVCVTTCPIGTYRDAATCLPCDSACASGCRGSGAAQCSACRDVRSTEGVCVEACGAGSYADERRVCVPCHRECAYDCYGPGADQCLPVAPNATVCRHAQRGDFCVPACHPALEHEDDRSVCRPCSALCAEGCASDGPFNCSSCRFVELNGQCLASCSPTHFNSNGTCVACNAQCGIPRIGGLESQCFGGGADECFACARVRRGTTCIDACALTEYEDPATHECLPCHGECLAACDGAGPDDCVTCRNWREESTCVRVCSIETHYADPASQQCIACDSECDVTTPLPSCPLGVCAKCLHKRDGEACVRNCSAGQYAATHDLRRAAEGICEACHPHCDECWGPGAAQCVSCTAYRFRDICVDTCPAKSFVRNQTCVECDSRCLLGCTDATNSGCVAVANISALLDPTANDYGCTFFAVLAPSAVDAITCLQQCARGTYPSDNGFCLPCDAACGRMGCVDGPGDCNECPVGTFLDLASTGECEPCHSQCGADGCVGGGSSRNCITCSGVRGPDGFCYADCDRFSNHFPRNDTTGDVVCHPCSDQCLGCMGPTAANCTTCQHFRAATADGTCIASCSGFASRTDGVLQCTPCHGLCNAALGCFGPGPDGCNECAVVRAVNGTCVARCPEGQVQVPGPGGGVGEQCTCAGYPEASAAGPSCATCHPLCNDTRGCRGPLASDCTACAFARLSDGSCTDEPCPENQELVPGDSLDDDARCICSSGVFTSDGTCAACHEECALGCIGPADTDCTGVPSGCAHAFDSRTLRCVKECADSEFTDGNSVCTCAGHRSDTSGDCIACHTECRDGCYGNSSTSCVACRAFEYRGTCVAACPSNSIADSSGVCLPCDHRCNDGCSQSADAAYCTGVRRCQAYWNGVRCSDTCTSSKGFFVNCSDPTLEDNVACANTRDLVCLSQCPATIPFFNVTSLPDSDFPLYPQLCATSCTQIEANGFTCSSGSGRATATQSEQGTSDLPIELIIGAGVLLLITIVVVVWVRLNASRQEGVRLSEKATLEPEFNPRDTMGFLIHGLQNPTFNPMGEPSTTPTVDDSATNGTAL
eukprot:m.1636775 g.1636775  ORF g.1636775 m.1636775 type:complete len:2110 (-) comp25423_c0_seq16:8386-14715(-)